MNKATEDTGRLDSPLSEVLGLVPERDVVAQLRLRILNEHGGTADGWQHHWNLTHGDSIMHREAVAEIERLRVHAVILAETAREVERERMLNQCIAHIDTIDDGESPAYRHCQEALAGLRA